MKGSTWHRWDLHYHTPSSHDYKNKGKSNQILIDELVADNVSAVVVTDHHRIDFSRIRELNELAAGKVKFFRGIELTSELGGNESVHFIVIFPEYLLDDIIRDSFLAPLGITDEKIHRDPALLQKSLPYREFLDKAKSIGAITSIHAGKKSNSIENIKNWCNSKQDFKKELLEKVDILETSKKEDIKDYNDIVFKSIGKICPVVVCSDYHSEYGYREYINNSSNPPTKVKRDATWIKGELTFDGLKQIIYEPSLRVRIQEENPEIDKLGSKIESLTIQNCKLFNESKLEFNSDMVAVIGEKGSGKTALLDMIASSLGAGFTEYPSFIQRAKNELKNSNITYNIYGDTAQTFSALNTKANVRCMYINPNRLSSFCENESEMQEFIKSILLHEDIITESDIITKKITTIQSNLVEIRALDEKVLRKNDIEQRIKDCKGKISTELNNKPELPSIDEEIKKEFIKLGEEIGAIEKELKQITESFVSIVHFDNNKDMLLNESAEIVRKQLYSSLENVISYEDFKLKFSYSESTLKALEKIQSQLENNKKELEDALQIKNEGFVKLKALIFKSEEQQTRYENWQKFYNKLLEELKYLEKEEADILLLESKAKSLHNECLSIMAEIVESKKKIFKYYEDLKDTLSERIGFVEKNRIEFIPTLKINSDELFKKLESIVSLKSINEETLKSYLSSKYVKMLNKIIEKDDISIELIEMLVDLFINPDAKKNIYGKCISDKIFKAGHDLTDILQVAFSDFIDVNYEITFNSIPMDQLSSGQKGIVLLKLLLRLDTSTDPLIIDQPEDNLDNKSVYDQLVEEFKTIKQKRQLFIATHNPNLVINTDAEQIIVAKYKKGAKDGYISYSSGANEDASIRDAICKILEGGKEAFINREKRYDFKRNNLK